MKALRISRFLAIDLELTCWDGKPPPGMSPEIIEVGVVEMDSLTGESLREKSYLVRPVRSSVSGFCTALTGIDAEMLRRDGRPFAEVVRTLAKEFGPARKASLAWGDDWSGIEAACVEHGVENPFPREAFLNIGLVATLVSGKNRRVGLYEIMEDNGVSETGRRHSGLDDARNTGRLFAALSARYRLSAMPDEEPGSPVP